MTLRRKNHRHHHTHFKDGETKTWKCSVIVPSQIICKLVEQDFIPQQPSTRVWHSATLPLRWAYLGRNRIALITPKFHLFLCQPVMKGLSSCKMPFQCPVALKGYLTSWVQVCSHRAVWFFSLPLCVYQEQHVPAQPPALLGDPAT